MKPLWIALALVACGGSQPPSRQSSDIPTGGISTSSLLQRVRPAIVQVEAGKSNIGFGFVVDKAGIIATTLHTVAGEAAIIVQLSDGARYPVTQIAGFDIARDLALLRIQPSRELPALMLGNSKALSAGDPVLAIGKPGRNDLLLFSARIAQVRPVCAPKDIAAGRCKQELTVLEIALPDEPISNGPLFDQRGEVVGIVAGFVPRARLGIAVPRDYLKPLLAQRAAMALEEFARSTEEYARSTRSARERDVNRNVPIVRHVPDYDVAIFDGCTPDDIAAIVQRIAEGVRSGAPLYNAGNREGCFLIFEGTALKIQRDAPCAGVRSAFESSIQQASSLGTYGEKAWALRDAFDGMLDAAKRWHDQRQQARPPAQP
jgi:S1-C subfamily serine protease